MQRDSKCRDPGEEMIFGYSRNRKRICVATTFQAKGGESNRRRDRVKRSYEKPRDEFILGILVNDNGNSAYVLTVK